MMLCVASLSFVGCEDPHTAHIDNYRRIVYFRDGGVQHLTLTRADAQAVFTIPVCKSGYDTSAMATVEIEVMDQSQLDIYNMINNTNFRIVDSECFAFGDESSFTFGADESYKAVRLLLDVDALTRAQTEAEADGVTPVVALQLFSDTSLSDGLNYLILVPSVEISYVTFRETRAFREYTKIDPMWNTVSTQLRMDIDNEWDFDCEIGIVENINEVLAEINADYGDAENGIVYKMLPDGAYEFPTTVSFVDGDNRADVPIRINRYFKNFHLEDANELPYYVLPLEIKTIGRRGLDKHAVNSYYYLRITHEYKVVMESVEEIELTEDMLTSPYTRSGDGQGIQGLVDNNENTYWHSVYSGAEGDPVFGYYIDIELPEPMIALQFSYCTRQNNDNAVPELVTIGCRESEDDEWTVAKENLVCPARGRAVWGDIEAVNLPMKSQYIRFGITNSVGSAGGVLKGELKGTPSVAMSELKVSGSRTGARTVVIYDDADEE